MNGEFQAQILNLVFVSVDGACCISFANMDVYPIGCVCHLLAFGHFEKMCSCLIEYSKDHSHVVFHPAYSSRNLPFPYQDV